MITYNKSLYRRKTFLRFNDPSIESAIHKFISSNYNSELYPIYISVGNDRYCIDKDDFSIVIRNGVNFNFEKRIIMNELFADRTFIMKPSYRSFLYYIYHALLFRSQSKKIVDEAIKAICARGFMDDIPQEDYSGDYFN